MARPKIKNKKQQVNLTIDKDIIKMARKVSTARGESLSQMTETSWKEIHDRFMGLQTNPSVTLKEVEDQLNAVKELLKHMEEDKKG